MQRDRATRGARSTPSVLDREKVARAFRRASAPLRQLPDFAVIGGIRCGTSSMFNYLNSHPEITMSSRKELHYFDWHYDRGVPWYRSWFPLPWDDGSLTGEATPSYLMDVNAPARAHATIPDAKLIVMLRNPVDRAISHFNLRILNGHEQCETLGEALIDEPSRVNVEPNSYRIGNNLDCYYLQGEYVRGLERWFRYFDRDQFYFVTSETMFEEPAASYTSLLDFLGLTVTGYPDFEVHNAAPRHEDDDKTAALLRERYAQANRDLYDLLGTDFGW